MTNEDISSRVRGFWAAYGYRVMTKFERGKDGMPGGHKSNMVDGLPLMFKATRQIASDLWYSTSGIKNRWAEPADRRLMDDYGDGKG